MKTLLFILIWMISIGLLGQNTHDTFHKSQTCPTLSSFETNNIVWTHVQTKHSLFRTKIFLQDSTGQCFVTFPTNKVKLSTSEQFITYKEVHFVTRNGKFVYTLHFFGKGRPWWSYEEKNDTGHGPDHPM